MKWYSRPCCSWPRGARVVCDTDTARCESSSSSAFTRLDLPVPLGAATTKRLPGVSILTVATPGATVAPLRLASLAAQPPAARAQNCRQCVMVDASSRDVPASAPQILALGEAMVEFNCTGEGDGRLYLQGFGGDTSNFAIAAARQGARVGCSGRAGRRCQRPHAARAVGCRRRGPPPGAQRRGGLHRDLLRHPWRARPRVQLLPPGLGRQPHAPGRPAAHCHRSGAGAAPVGHHAGASPTAPATPPTRPSTWRVPRAWRSASTPTCG